MSETIGNCTLYLGDSMEILPTLEPVDLIACDPPYKLTTGGGDPKDSRRMGGKFAKGAYDNQGCIVDCEIDWPDFMPLFFDALKENAHCYVMSNNRHVKNMLNSAEQAGFKFHNLLVWNKGTATPNRWYMKNLEFTGFFYKGKAFFINDCGSTQLQNVPNLLKSEHPTAKPVELMRLYIENSTKTGDMVLDPFMGSGSTGSACAMSDRKFIGIEKDTKYFDIACKNIERAYKSPFLI